MKCGLIGKTLKHSYSKIIHREFADYDYDLYELSPEDLGKFVDGEVSAFNVTIPYKKEIIKYLDLIDPRANSIGAVNTVVKRNGKLYGYNTDFDGMKFMLERAGIGIRDKKVMILGNGGTGNTATAVAQSLGAREIIKVSRSGEVNYGNYKKHCDAEVIINATPVGMYPDNYSSPVTLDGFEKLTGVADVIYNPNMTKLLYSAKERGIKYTGGLPMLVAQAKYASELFTGKTVPDGETERVIDKLKKEMLNIVLVGMPGSGKSSVGRAIAKELGREFIDTDEEVEKRTGMPVSVIFERYGEEYFRKLESEVASACCKGSGKVIATGGGIVKNPENYFPLKNNGKIFLIERSIEKLSTDGRPLSKDYASVKKIYSERKDSYERFADEKINNDGELQSAVKGVIEKL